MTKEPFDFWRYSNERMVKRHEQGAVLIMVCLVGAVLLMLVGLGINLGHGHLVRTELQAAADAAALAGASTLCTSRDCFQDSVSAAIDTLQLQTVRSELSAKKMVLDPAEGPQWDLGDMEITIQRGRWWPEGSPPFFSGEPEFEAIDRIDGSLWQADFPGIPANVAANAVRVKIEVPRSHLFFISAFSSLTRRFKAEAIAIGGEIEETEVAPFALPLCAMLDENQDFSARATCDHPRYFTRSDRYCSDPDDDDDCGVLPNTNYAFTPNGGCNYEPGRDRYCTVTDGCKEDDSDCPGGGDPSSMWDFKCGTFLDVRTAQLTDSYGVVGLPQTAVLGGIALNEGSIHDIALKKLRGLVPARLGEPFYILHQGFEDKDTEKTLGRLMSRGGEMAFSYGWSETRWHLPESWSENGPSLADLPCGCEDTRLDPRTNPPCNGGPLYHPPQIGLCNSSRGYRYHTSQNQAWNHKGHECLALVGAAFVSQWRVKIPVIADASAEALPCGAKDPRIQPHGSYMIVGFVDTIFYDSDIGTDPPQFPEIPLSIDDDPPNKEGECARHRRLGAAIPHDWWPFHAPDPNNPAQFIPTRCNNVRAQTACNTRLLPSSESTGPTKPQLVR